MSDRRSWIRQFIAAVPLLFAAVLAPLAGSQSRFATVDELAYGEATGYFFFWDPAVLSLEEATTEPGADYWSLSDGEGTIDILAYTAPGATTAECVRGFLDAMAADPATVSIESLPFLGGGPPQILGGYVAEIVRTTTGPVGQEKFAEVVKCQEIVPGQSLALVYIHMPAQTYNDRALREVRLDGIDTSVSFELNHDPRPEPIPGGATGAAGTLSVSAPCNLDVVRILATGGDDGGVWAIDPWSFEVVGVDGAEPVATTKFWTLPDARPEASLHLPSGARGLVRIVVAVEEDEDFDLYFSAPSGESVFLTSSRMGCGGSGGAPVPIDIE